MKAHVEVIKLFNRAQKEFAASKNTWPWLKRNKETSFNWPEFDLEAFKQHNHSIPMVK